MPRIEPVAGRSPSRNDRLTANGRIAFPARRSPHLVRRKQSRFAEAAREHDEHAAGLGGARAGRPPMALIKDTTTQSFMKDVIEESKTPAGAGRFLGAVVRARASSSPRSWKRPCRPPRAR